MSNDSDEDWLSKIDQLNKKIKEKVDYIRGLLDDCVERLEKQIETNSKLLADAQKKYAALDAVACIRIYNKINQLKETNDYILEETFGENDECD